MIAMSPETISRLLAVWAELPDDVRSPPATASQLQQLEDEVGKIPPAFRWFLSEMGGGPVGSEWVDDVAKLRATHKKFKKEPWSLSNCFIFGWDGSGNPMVIDPAS